ncbi:MAG TPA: serine/threonine-protein kinase [Vicinamibacteria bacterium]|nr:serine/threonine-protein kinase [Vicinamibacteria bacterium]
MELVGQKVGAYRILSLLGRGGTAEVYKAFHPATKRDVAIKVLLQEVSQDLGWVRRFRQEVELLGRLDHPHILPIYDAGDYEGRPFLVMKYVGNASTLRSQLTGQPWPLNRVVKVVMQVADALDAAHHAGVVHRDIKPSNVLVTPDLKCLVFDFGIAKPFRRDDVTTGSNDVVGTPEFMSPEQCKGDKVDHRSDVYSLGVMTYQLLAGHVPFTAETAVGILVKHLTETLPVPPRGVALPPAVSGVLRKAMAREPRDRYQTAGELAAAFEESADQKATVTLHAADLRRALIPALGLPSWVRQFRRPGVRLASATFLVALLLATLYALWPDSETSIAYGPPQPTSGTVSATMQEEAAGSPERAARRQEAREPIAPIPQPAAPISRSATFRIETTGTTSVFLDGKPAGIAPGEFRSIAPGPHVLVLDAGHGQIHEETVVATAGSVHILRYDFPRPRPRAAPDEIREWTGTLTDEDCGVSGGKMGALHLECAQRCIREGKRPMLYSRGRLYRLDGLDKLDLSSSGSVAFKGWLEVDTIHVIDK